MTASGEPWAIEYCLSSLPTLQETDFRNDWLRDPLQSCNRTALVNQARQGQRLRSRRRTAR